MNAVRFILNFIGALVGALVIFFLYILGFALVIWSSKFAGAFILFVATILLVLAIAVHIGEKRRGSSKITPTPQPPDEPGGE
jgi:membrane protein DedA with SNARE-associated domain